MSNDTAQEATQTPEAPEAQEAQEIELNLGRCHYGDFDEEAVAVAASPDGGWIAVCEEHKQRAQEEGYELHDAD